jgi:hypothetical protein
MTLGNERGNASLASVLGIVAVLGLYVLQDQNKTQNMRAQVLSTTLSSIAKQSNVAALSRTQSLLLKDAAGETAVKIQGKSFVISSGSGFQIQQGALLMTSPDPRSAHWMASASGLGTPLKTLVTIEKVETDASGSPTAMVAVAGTTIDGGTTSKSIKTRVRFDLVALNGPIASPPPGGGSSTTNPGGAVPNGTTTVASSSPNASGGGPCGTLLSPGNSSATSNTGSNTANSVAQGANTGSSAQTGPNSASGCSMSQTGGSTAGANGSATGPNSKVTTSTTTKPGSASSSSTATSGIP